MMRLGIVVTTVALLALAGCSGDAEPKAEPTHGPTPVECMSNQSVAVATVALAHDGQQDRWSAQSTISPRCPKS